MISWNVVSQPRALLADVPIGGGLPVAVMGVLNVSPESFYAGSVQPDLDSLVRAAEAMVKAGAALIDVGARSTAPYRSTDVPEADEQARLGRAVDALARRLPVPVSADTTRPAAARAALEAGARVLNDVSGLDDPAMAALARTHDAGVVIMASPASLRPAPPGGDERPAPAPTVKRCLAEGLERARAAGIAAERVVLDPGLGFFRHASIASHRWDLAVLAGLDDLLALGRPLCVGVSRKSFIGAVTGRASPEERLAGSLAATTVAVLHGAALIRTHDVAATLDAIRVAEAIRSAAAP